MTKTRTTNVEKINMNLPRKFNNMQSLYARIKCSKFSNVLSISFSPILSSNEISLGTQLVYVTRRVHSGETLRPRNSGFYDGLCNSCAKSSCLLEIIAPFFSIETNERITLYKLTNMRSKIYI